MAEPRFIVEGLLSGPGEYRLDRVESRHASQVLRLRAGDWVIVFDGKGHRAEAEITDGDRDSVAVMVREVHTEEHLPLELTIATAIPKGKRWQMLVEKCTELGVDRILPMLTERSVAKGEGDIEKWRRWIIEAAKQSRRSWIPEIAPPLPMAKITALAGNEQAALLVADAGGAQPGEFRDALEQSGRAIVMVGPEGGFTGEELAECLARGGRAVRLSPFVLRVETAAATVCAILREMVS